MVKEKEILKWLEEVKDPEIPVLSLVDLGVITDIKIGENGFVHIKMTPTFAGCPAIDYMKKDIEAVLQKNDIEHFNVEVTFETQWTSNMISAKGREMLKKFGLAPPPQHNLIIDLDILEKVACPYCDSNDTSMKTPFGATLCRSTHFCNNCSQAFEQFKPI